MIGLREESIASSASIMLEPPEEIVCSGLPLYCWPEVATGMQNLTGKSTYVKDAMGHMSASLW